MTQKELMLSEQLYCADDDELRADYERAQDITYLYNQTTIHQKEERAKLLKELFGNIGKNAVIQPPFRCDYGSNIRIGDNFYANYDCMIVDVCEVTIGDNVLFGPRVCVFTAGHPINAAVRNSGLEFGKKIKIGNNVWIGGNTVINPGVTIGDNAVIGSGSVVTKDIPSNVVAVGNPCKVIKEIKPEDK
ncbi:MAG: sugar O-acetyltransferase [Acutalibacteraceae bacterium]